MKISHEVPICLLNESKSFNDYDYCLLHLLEKPEYRKYYKESSESGREIILDNSLFELGDSLSPEILVDGINDIKPTWYIVPDAMNDADTTIKRFIDWQENYRSKVAGKVIGVVQGNSFDDLVKCYLFLSKNADKVAIPFLSTAYQNMFKDIENPLEKASTGRNYLIKYLMAHGLFNFKKPLHILGATIPGEFLDPIYRRYVESIDTSCPITNGISKNLININTYTKPKVLLADLIDNDITEEQKSIIYKNIKTFREICEGGI